MIFTPAKIWVKLNVQAVQGRNTFTADKLYPVLGSSSDRDDQLIVPDDYGNLRFLGLHEVIYDHVLASGHTHSSTKDLHSSDAVEVGEKEKNPGKNEEKKSVSGKK